MSSKTEFFLFPFVFPVNFILCPTFWGGHCLFGLFSSFFLYFFPSNYFFLDSPFLSLDRVLHSPGWPQSQYSDIDDLDFPICLIQAALLTAAICVRDLQHHVSFTTWWGWTQYSVHSRCTLHAKLHPLFAVSYSQWQSELLISSWNSNW